MSMYSRQAGPPTPPPPLDNLALFAWAVACCVVLLACGSAGAMALYLTQKETELALYAWGVAVALGVLLVEPVWVGLLVAVGSSRRQSDGAAPAAADD